MFRYILGLVLIFVLLIDLLKNKTYSTITQTTFT